MEIVYILLAGAVGFALASWLYGSYISKLIDDNEALWDEIEDLCDARANLEAQNLDYKADLMKERSKTRAKTRANESN